MLGFVVGGAPYARPGRLTAVLGGLRAGVASLVVFAVMAKMGMPGRAGHLRDGKTSRTRAGRRASGRDAG